MSKKFTTHEQQILILKSKELTIDEESKAIDALKSMSYYSLINGYKEIFKNKEGNYYSDVSIDDIINLYNFDTSLKNILFVNILKIERKIKSLISYYFCLEYGDKSEDYLNVNNYNYVEKNHHNINKLVNIFQDLIFSKEVSKRRQYINHYTRKHGDVPLWVLVNALTLGNMSKMYSLLQEQTKIKIAKEYNVNHKELDAMLKLLKNFRNVCAHNERVFTYKSNSSIMDNELRNYLLQDEERKKVGKNDVLAVLVCFYYLLDRKSFFICIYDMYKLCKFSKVRHPYNQILLNKMGLSMNMLDKLFEDGNRIENATTLMELENQINEILENMDVL